MDISIITSSLAVGGANIFPDGARHHKLDTYDVDNLRRVGVTQLLSVREYGDDLDGVDVPYRWIPTENAYEAITANWLGEIYSFVLGAGKGMTYIFCNEGLDRSPSAVYGVLRWSGMSKDDALNCIRRVRPQVRLPYVPMVDAALLCAGVS